MNRQRYLEIRDSVDFGHDPRFLWRFGVETLFLFAACIFISLRFSHSSLKLLAIPLVSTIMFRSFTFMHEAVHGLASKDHRLNHLLGVISGTLCLLSFDSWKQSHIEHHRLSGNIDRAHVAAMIKVFPTFPKPLQKILTFGWKCWLPTLSFLQHTVFWAITFRYTVKRKSSPAEIMSAIFPAVFWGGLLVILPVGTTAAVLLPSVIIYLIGTEIINAPHHLGLTYFRGDAKIPPWDQFKTARSCVYPKWLSRFVVLNFKFHTEHHMYPYVPWYHLDKLHQKLRDELGEDYNLDPGFSWILRNRSQDLGKVFGSDQVIDSRLARAA